MPTPTFAPRASPYGDALVVHPNGRTARNGPSVGSMSHTTPVAGERSPRSGMPTLTVPYRFRGPAGSANGGYMCGLIAGYVDGPATVTLRRPPPLAAPMTVEVDATGSLLVLHGATRIAEAEPAQDGPAVLVPGSVPRVGLRRRIIETNPPPTRTAGPVLHFPDLAES